jgi:hypothetical protein
LGRGVRHIPAILILVALLLFLMIRNVAPDPYIYDEADYMYAASLGIGANYTDSPTLPAADFVRTGLSRGKDPAERQGLSEQIRASNDVVFYRHWHGPLYLYALLPVSRLALTERQTRGVMLAIPAMTLMLIYCGCLWLIPGRAGTFAALVGSVLFVSGSAVAESTELAPHHLFAFLSVAFLFLVLKFLATGGRTYWYGAAVAAGLAFCTLEVAFVLIGTLAICGYLERRKLRPGWRSAGTSLAFFAGTVLIVWPAALYKLSFVKGYLFMAYLGLLRKSPWGNEGFLDVWRHRLLDSPLEWGAIAVSLYLFFRNGQDSKRQAYPILIYILLMLLGTARVTTSSTRYSLLFMPALDIFAAFTLTPFLLAWPARKLSVALILFGALLGIGEYREFTRNRNPDPRPPAILNYIRENQLENATLLVPQLDLPMIHFYFPRMHLHGYAGADPGVSSYGILHRGYPVRSEIGH